jgi:hypothetical protein
MMAQFFGYARALHTIRPASGKTFMFKSQTDSALSGIPAHVIHVWPRFRSGDYLVTLKFVKPVPIGNAFTHEIGAFMSELEPCHG